MQNTAIYTYVEEPENNFRNDQDRTHAVRLALRLVGRSARCARLAQQKRIVLDSHRHGRRAFSGDGVQSFD